MILTLQGGLINIVILAAPPFPMTGMKEISFVPPLILTMKVFFGTPILLAATRSEAHIPVQ
jgi:hypothetical protein